MANRGRLPAGGMSRKSNIDYCATQVAKISEDLVEQILTNSEGMDAEVIDNWKQQLGAIIIANAKLKNATEASSKVVSKICRENQAADNDENGAVNQSADWEQQAHREIAAITARFDPDSDPGVREALDYVVPHREKMGGGASGGMELGDDEDIQVVQRAMTESDTKCPYSHLPFDRAMKNSACIHRVNKASFDEMMKNSKGTNRHPCPIPGCGKVWRPDTTRFDEEYQRRVDRFRRLHAVTAASSSSSSSSAGMQDFTQL